MPMHRLLSGLATAGVVLALLGIDPSASASAETYPSGVIRVVVPAVAGTPPDIISRLVADELARSEGWRMIVENRPGALQTIAMAEVEKRPADGYTILVMSAPMMVTPSLLPRSGTRPDSD